MQFPRVGVGHRGGLALSRSAIHGPASCLRSIDPLDAAVIGLGLPATTTLQRARR